MPNHIHVLLYPTHKGKSLSHLISPGKRFMAYDIVNALKDRDKQDLLGIMQKGVQKKESARGKKHQVFRLSFDARECDSERILLQKLDYIHHNPVRGKWQLVDDFVMYEHASASFYELSRHGVVDVTHYMDLGSMAGHWVVQVSEVISRMGTPWRLTKR